MNKHIQSSSKALKLSNRGQGQKEREHRPHGENDKWESLFRAIETFILRTTPVLLLLHGAITVLGTNFGAEPIFGGHPVVHGTPSNWTRRAPPRTSFNSNSPLEQQRAGGRV